MPLPSGQLGPHSMRWSRFILGLVHARLIVAAANFVLQRATLASGPLVFLGLALSLVLFLGAALVLAFSLGQFFRR